MSDGFELLALTVTHSSLLVTSTSWTCMFDPHTSMPSRPPSLPPRMITLWTSPLLHVSSVMECGGCFLMSKRARTWLVATYNRRMQCHELRSSQPRRDEEVEDHK
jgi:hypothetical protein